MNWTQVDIYTTTEGIEPVGAMLLELGAGGYQVTDAADFQDFLDGKNGRWDYIDDQVMELKHSETTLTIYFADGAQGAEQLASLKSGLIRLKELDIDNEWGRLEYSLSGVKEEDWAEAWKQYYKPVHVGERLVICPSWQQYDAKAQEVVVQLDPGMAFGTGEHSSTRLCMELMQKYVKQGARVLDVGCGSGILAVSAVLLGGESAMGVDIDEMAVRIANENADINNVGEKCSFSVGSLASGIDGKFDIIFANIVADVILALLPDIQRLLAPDGVLITSGIIDTREDDVISALPAANLALDVRLENRGWVGLSCKHA